MGALAPVTPWLPEDDLLLKSAVEAGASLESLAKGAVQFSRRFSIRELQDRWHALLYDPVVSAEAAFHMTELERSNSNIPTKFGRTGYSKENKSSVGKRNAENVRSSYYSSRKKFRFELFNSMDLGILVPPNDNHFIGNGEATHLGLEDSHMDIIHNAFPEILADGCCMGGFNNPIEDGHPVQEDNLQGKIHHVVTGDLAFTQNACSSRCNAVHEDSEMNLEMAAQEPKIATPSTDCFLAELSNSLFNGVDSFMNVEGKDNDKSYYDGLSSLLVNSTDNTSQGALPNSTEQKSSATQNNSGNGSLGDHETSELDGTNATSSSEVKPVSGSPAIDPHPEIVDGVICCVLNTDHPEIPCNEDIFLPSSCHPMSVSSLARRNFKDSGNQISTSVRDISACKERSTGYSVHMPKNPGRVQVSSQGKLETGQPSQGSIDGNNAVATIQYIPRNSSMGSDGHENFPKKDIGNSKLEQGALAVDSQTHAANAGDGSIEMVVSEEEVNPTVDEHLSDSDEELPNYSDIEAMILDMDLDPDDQDIYELKVSKYQNEDTRRAIIRLEQAAYSYMQRAIASHGAFAILYGRRSKHYIKKPEILLGRSTEDLIVDIDLGREKGGSKISRRQAIVRLEDDGSFRMKNLGKYPISVNEKEVDPGQSLVLKPDCLIEIRGMIFIFETNETRVKEYLNSIEKVDRDG